MQTLKLDSGQSFGIENHDKQLRLVVYNNGVENVCRKSTIKELERFIQSSDNHIFKGRLQLFKDEVGISIQVKGEIAGSIHINDFINCLKNAGNGELKTL